MEVKYLYMALGAGVVGLVFAFIKSQWVNRQDPGTEVEEHKPDSAQASFNGISKYPQEEHVETDMPQPCWIMQELVCDQLPRFEVTWLEAACIQHLFHRDHAESLCQQAAQEYSDIDPDDDRSCKSWSGRRSVRAKGDEHTLPVYPSRQLPVLSLIH